MTTWAILVAPARRIRRRAGPAWGGPPENSGRDAGRAAAIRAEADRLVIPNAARKCHSVAPVRRVTATPGLLVYIWFGGSSMSAESLNAVST